MATDRFGNPYARNLPYGELSKLPAIGKGLEDILLDI